VITFVGHWEKDWLAPKVELFMWRQLKAAYHVERLVMVPRLLGKRTSVDEFETMDEALADCAGSFVLLEPTGDTTLAEFSHPEDAVYIFGKAGTNNLKFSGVADTVRIVTPSSVDMFAINAAAIVLAHRYEHG